MSLIISPGGTAPVIVSSNGIIVNSNTISDSYTIPAGNNAVSAGPVVIANAVSVVVSDGCVWVIV